MPIVPTYRRQERYRAPDVQLASGSPRRVPEAYENTMQEFGRLSKDVLDYLEKRRKKQEEEKKKKEAKPKNPQNPNPDNPNPENPNPQNPNPENPNPGGGKKPSQTSQTPSADGESFSPDKNLQIRTELLDAVRAEVHEKGTLQTASLDQFAVSRLGEADAETPAARDYMMLRAAAREEEKSAFTRQRSRLASQEENLVRGVGAMAPTPQALEAYLSAQLPAYETRLKENGAAEEDARLQAASVRAQTAAECVRRSLAAGNRFAAQAVFGKYERELPEPVREECAQKIRFSSASSRARDLWRRAALQTDGTPEARERWARERLEPEEDTELKQTALQTVSSLRAEAQARSHAEQARVYRSLASAPDADEAERMVTAQRVLNAGELPTARRAARELFSASGVTSDAETFNRLYFSATEKDNARAFEKGRISARDYLTLEAARHLRAGGKPDADAEFLCRGIEVWGEKKGLSQEDAARVKHAVLASASGTQERLAALARVKSLLDF